MAPSAAAPPLNPLTVGSAEDGVGHDQLEPPARGLAYHRVPFFPEPVGLVAGHVLGHAPCLAAKLPQEKVGQGPQQPEHEEDQNLHDPELRVESRTGGIVPA